MRSMTYPTALILQVACAFENATDFRSLRPCRGRPARQRQEQTLFACLKADLQNAARDHRYRPKADARDVRFRLLLHRPRLGEPPRSAMSRYDLTDFEWRVVEPLFPNKPRGVPRVDDRRVLNGIFWVLRSGAPCVTCLIATGHARFATTVSYDGESAQTPNSVPARAHRL